jgi:hypothetical protein
MGPHHRREFFYGQLRRNAAAAKAIRLFGLADFLRGWILDKRRTSNAALRRVDRRELLVQSLFAAGRAILWYRPGHGGDCRPARRTDRWRCRDVRRGRGRVPVGPWTAWFAASPKPTSS